MKADEPWRGWALNRNWAYQPVWKGASYTFRGGGLAIGAPRRFTKSWAGTFGGLPCFGFEAGPGNKTLGVLYVVGVRIPQVQFPDLTIVPADYALLTPSVAIDPEFDLSWSLTSTVPQFAREVASERFRKYLGTVVQDFHQLWFERDAILLSCTHRIAPDQVDGYLTTLRQLVDTIPTLVFERLGAPGRVPLRQPAPPPMAAHPRLAAGDQWHTWAQQRGWVYTANARQLVERFHHAPLPAGADSQFSCGFVGKFADLPCFGWKWVSHQAARVRHVVALRNPKLAFKPVRLTLEDPLLAELVGTGDIEIGVASFDERWRVTSTDAEFARQLLGGQLWRRFEAADLPAFGQVWFERDVVAIISEGEIQPADVDSYLVFLHGIFEEIAAAAG